MTKHVQSALEQHTALMGKNASQLTTALKEHLGSHRHPAHCVSKVSSSQKENASHATNHPMALMEKPALPFPTAMMV